MRALTLWRPWDWAMAFGGKDVENRTWKPWQSVIGQRIALHAGEHYDLGGAARIRYLRQYEFGDRDLVALDRAIRSEARVPGVIVATTLLVGWVRIDDNRVPFASAASHGEVDVVDAARTSPWLFGPYGWVVRDTVALKAPIPAKGNRGLWSLSDEQEHQVREQERLSRAA